MKLPKRLEPEILKDSIVQLLFSSDVPPELLLGRFHELFKHSYNFLGSPFRSDTNRQSAKGLLVQPLSQGYFLDASKRVKVNLNPESITFNCNNSSYSGWDNYYPVIESTVKGLFESHLIKFVTRVGCRYVTQFENTDLMQSLNISYTMTVPKLKLDSSVLKSEFSDNDLKFIITLVNNAMIVDETTKRPSINSFLDIDVIKLHEGLRVVDEVLSYVNITHERERELFYSFLKPDFLSSLNPSY
jgi:uncharacterized protein (TIGR04255 family)